jgi:hypothetical protein
LSKVSARLFELRLFQQTILIHCAQKVRESIPDRLANMGVALAMEQPLFTIDIILILEDKEEGMPEVRL